MHTALCKVRKVNLVDVITWDSMLSVGLFRPVRTGGGGVLGCTRHRLTRSGTEERVQGPTSSPRYMNTISLSPPLPTLSWHRGRHRPKMHSLIALQSDELCVGLRTGRRPLPLLPHFPRHPHSHPFLLSFFFCLSFLDSPLNRNANNMPVHLQSNFVTW